MHRAAQPSPTASPRETEADLLLKAALRLQEVVAGQDSALGDALLFNRQQWALFLTSATGGDNPLPTDMRQNVANLGQFVMAQTATALTDPKPERLGTLISINCELAAGLRGGK